MNRRHFLGTAVATSLGSLLLRHSSIPGARADATSPRERRAGFETVGLYVSLPTDPPPTNPAVYEFYRACGYNYLEFCEAGFRTRPDLLADYYAEMSRAITMAHGKGFRVGIVLLAGMEQWQGPEPTGRAGAFSPLETAKLQERLTRLRQAVRSLSHADIFVFLPGDPGGDPRGRSTLNDCIGFCSRV